MMGVFKYFERTGLVTKGSVTQAPTRSNLDVEEEIKGGEREERRAKGRIH